MKKVLIGLAAGALAVAATGAGSASAAGTSVYDQATTGRSVAKTLIDASGLASALDDCGNTGNNNGLPDYTVFFPVSDAVFSGVLAALDMTLGELAAQPALVKTVLLYHVHQGNISPTQLADNSNSTWQSMGGLTLVKTSSQTQYTYDPFPDLGDLGAAPFDIPINAAFLPTANAASVSYFINGIPITNASLTQNFSTDVNTVYATGTTAASFLVELNAAKTVAISDITGGMDPEDAIAKLYGKLLPFIDIADDVHTLTSRTVTPSATAEACNGWVYTIAGLLSPTSALTTQGLTADGSTSTPPASSGELPKTGSESMALTYAALASLIAGAGVLVIRRRSVA